MKSSRDIEKLFKELHDTTNAEMDERVLRDVSQALDGPSRLNVWRIIMKSKMIKLTAAAVIIIAVLIGVNQFGGSIDGATTALASVIENVQKAHSVSFKKIIITDNNTHTYEDMINESGVLRSLMSHGAIMITDSSTNITLWLMPQGKTARLVRRIGRKKKVRLSNRLNWLSKLHDEDNCKYQGQEEIDGKLTDVYLNEIPFEKTTVWVDPQTSLPVRVEMVQLPNNEKDFVPTQFDLSDADFGGEGSFSQKSTIISGRGSGLGITSGMKVVNSDFKWNEDLDPDLFSFEAPDGYTVTEKLHDSSEFKERDLVNALAFWAKETQGSFPVNIDELIDPNMIKPLLVKHFDKDGEPKEEMEQAMAFMNRVLKAHYFAQEQKIKDNWNYDSEGVQFGDSDMPLCWWEVENSDNYQVIFGDLSISEITLEELEKLLE